MKEMNVRYQNQGNYQLPCITTKEHNELHISKRNAKTELWMHSQHIL